MKTLAWTAIALMMALSTARPAGAQDRAADREAIEELMWRYARALDTFDADAYVAVYTEDGEFQAGPTPTQGRQALWQMIEDLRTNREERAAAGNPAAPLFHMTTDSWTEFVDDTHARHHTYWLTISGGNPPSILAAGRGIDDLVKVDGRWLIRSRNVAPPED